MMKVNNKIRRNFSLKETGFSLLEMLLCLAIFAIIMTIAFTLFHRSKDTMLRGQAKATISEAARSGIDRLSKDLRQMGTNAENNTEGPPLPEGDPIVIQPILCWGGPYQIVFNADLDFHKNVNERLGAINVVDPSVYNFPAAAMTTLYTCTGSGAGRSYGDGNDGAETIRYTLDLPNGDGEVNSYDHESEYWNDPYVNEPENATENPYDYILWKQVCGQDVYGVNQETSLQPIMKHFRGWGGSVDNYPGGTRPEPLFKYWGHFFDDVDDPATIGYDESLITNEQLDLWGDLDNDGLLSQSELKAWEDGIYRQIGIDPATGNNIFPEPKTGPVDSHNQATFDQAADDRNGNGKWDETLDDVLAHVVITVTTEAPVRDKTYINTKFGSNSGYFFQDTQMTTVIYPRNLKAQGRLQFEGQVSPVATKPNPGATLTPTITPPPTITPTPTGSPTSTPTLTSTPTITPIYCVPGEKLVQYTLPLKWPKIIYEYAENISIFELKSTDFRGMHWDVNDVDCSTSEELILTVDSIDREEFIYFNNIVYTGNVEWSCVVSFDQNCSMQAITTDHISGHFLEYFDPDPDFDFDGTHSVPTDFMTLDAPGYYQYSHNGSLQGALIYARMGDLLEIRINAHSNQESRFGGHKQTQGCYFLEKCNAYPPSIAITSPGTWALSGEGIQFRAFGTYQLMDVHFFINGVYSSSDYFGSGTNEYYDELNPHFFPDGEVEFTIMSDIGGCRIHDSHLTTIGPLPTLSPTPAYSPTPSVTPTPACKFGHDDFKMKLGKFNSTRVEIKPKNIFSQDIDLCAINIKDWTTVGPKLIRIDSPKDSPQWTGSLDYPTGEVEFWNFITAEKDKEVKIYLYFDAPIIKNTFITFDIIPCCGDVLNDYTVQMK